MSSERRNATSVGLQSPLKWHSPGGKSYLAQKIVSLMPPRQSKDNPDGYLHSCEPFAGGLSVLLANDPEGISEVVNDLHLGLHSFWCCLASIQLFPEFCRRVQMIPFSERAWQSASLFLDIGCDCGSEVCVSMATAFFLCCRQSLAGRMKSFAPLSKTRIRRGMNEQASAWLNCLEGLPDVHERLRRVVILNRDALDVIRQQDGKETLFYLDPPYPVETRTAKEVYAHEMSQSQHFDLLSLLVTLKGRFLLSGYRSPMYDSFAAKHGWKRHDYELPNNAAGGDEKRRMVESVWVNY